MLLHIAYKAEKGLDIRQENSIAKIFHAHMVHKVIDTAIQLHGALGFSQDTPLAKWYTQVRAQRLVDGPDEVHKWRIGKNVIKAFREHGTTASAAGGICSNRLRMGGQRREAPLPTLVGCDRTERSSPNCKAPSAVVQIRDACHLDNLFADPRAFRPASPSLRRLPQRSRP